MKRLGLAEEMAGGRELVALVGGPWAGRWWWADQLAEAQRAAGRYPIEHPAGRLAGYHPAGGPTEHRVKHPDLREAEDGVSGWVFTWQPGACSEWAQTLAPAAAPAARPAIPQQRQRRQEIATERAALPLHIAAGSERAA
ncbi:MULTISPECIES: hypothetical protein [unclassified Pseudonocardia]|uniref:hypothetical protein n=1 Tax=unclassified Pseudonocardia TaxID=2619320 RepID=UPI00094B201B|nr:MULTISPECIES: hypothetical protein [unclassified Pseudonocardia]OLL89549.1 hypothetical protein Ae331Ps2_6223c [Pseudonocardia sp. Ae331_Ps2]OLM08325.1 hypothetical protein Ae505Ps2_6229 [Pseudonocardia sp. Ae505_Ps2]